MTKVVATVALMGLALGVVFASVISVITITFILKQEEQTLIVSGLPVVPGILTVGTVRLPLDTLCRVTDDPTNIISNYTCLVCYNDCQSVHNTFGGKCGVDPQNATLQTCLCAKTAEDKTPQGIGNDATTTCNIKDPIKANSAPFVKAAVIARMDLLLCPSDGQGGYISTNCKNDCINNHGFSTGVCEVTPILDTSSGSGDTLHCQCS